VNHSRSGGPSDRENVTSQLLKYPLDNTAFGLGVYSARDTSAEASAWLSELLERSSGMPGQLTVHVYDLFGAKPPRPGTPAGSCGANHSDFDHYCARPPVSWWPALKRFHKGK
jgi:hypothetical protein